MSNEEICGAISQSGANGEPLACGFKPHATGLHAWATLPTYTPATPEPHVFARSASIMSLCVHCACTLGKIWHLGRFLTGTGATTNDIKYAVLAYNAYREASHGVSAITGTPLPEFDDTPHAVQCCWLEAARAVAAHVREVPGLKS